MLTIFILIAFIVDLVLGGIIGYRALNDLAIGPGLWWGLGIDSVVLICLFLLKAGGAGGIGEGLAELATELADAAGDIGGGDGGGCGGGGCGGGGCGS